MKRFLALAAVAALVGCGGTGEGEGPVHRVRVPPGASFSAVADSLARYDILASPTIFRIYGRITGAAEEIQAGTYEFHEGAGWRTVLDDLTAGHIAADRLVVPEGYQIRWIAPALARISGRNPDSLAAYMLDTATAARFRVPGPTLEGYLYPATYLIPAGAPVDAVIRRMVEEYREVWTPERRALADSVGLSEREVVTLASIVEREAKVAREMPIIAAVYLNRLDIGYLLQADPTVQYALGTHHRRLFYSQIDSVAEDPYNTYKHPGLPPGPIGSPSVRAIDAVLHPADVDYLYFVARPDGTHIFNRHLVEHNRAKARIQRERRAARRAGRPDSTAGGPAPARPPGSDSVSRSDR